MDYTKYFKVEKSEKSDTKDLFYFEKQLHPKYGEIYVQKCRMK